MAFCFNIPYKTAYFFKIIDNNTTIYRSHLGEDELPLPDVLYKNKDFIYKKK